MDTNNLIRAIVESMPSSSSSWIDVLSGLLTPLIALIAVYIAYQQYRTNSLRLRHEVYERRLRVYKAVQAFLSEIMREGDIDFPRTSHFYAEASEAAFLFDREIQTFIDDLHAKAIDLHTLHERIYPSDGSPGLPVGEERSKVAHENGELLKWLIHQLPKSKDLFGKHMRIK